jgi:hypothetical protein
VIKDGQRICNFCKTWKPFSDYAKSLASGMQRMTFSHVAKRRKGFTTRSDESVFAPRGSLKSLIPKCSAKRQ